MIVGSAFGILFAENDRLRRSPEAVNDAGDEWKALLRHPVAMLAAL